MNANHDLQRRLARYYETHPPLRAPDWVLQSALTTIETSPQRRGLTALRRYFDMPASMKLAASAAVVIAVAAVAIWQLVPPGPGGPPTPTPTPTASPPPVPTAPTSPAPTTYVPPALTGTFTSDFHGLSMSFPEGWTVQAATEPWPAGNPPFFGQPAGDFLFDPVRMDHMALAVASRPLGATPLDEWLTDFLTAEGCTLTGDGVAVDGADRVIGTDCGFALASSQGRGYIFAVLKSDDEVELRAFDAGAFLEDILATVQLQPEDAVDAAPTASP